MTCSDHICLRHPILSFLLPMGPFDRESPTRRHLSRSADVYAFGVLLWELWCSAGAWSGMSQAQVIAAILVRGRKLEFPSGTPGDYKVCTPARRRTPARRPSHAKGFTDVYW
jgi:hypothetical protein